MTGKHLFYAALTSGNFGLIASILGAISGQLDQFINEENLEYLAELLNDHNEYELCEHFHIYDMKGMLVYSWLS